MGKGKDKKILPQLTRQGKERKVYYIYIHLLILLCQFGLTGCGEL